MDFLERFNSKFGAWYEGLFGGDAGELRPKDVLRKITTAMEDHRKEGFDSKVYVPNKYILELAVDDAEERDYLLSFLDEEELVSVLQRFMAQNQYHTRGPLDFTIAEVPDAVQAGREKLRVKVRFEKGLEARPPAPNSGRAGGNEAKADPLPPETGAESGLLPQDWGPGGDLPTVAEIDFDAGTVPAIAWAALAVTAPDGRKSHFSLTKPEITIGRSRNVGNDLVLDNDGMASKAHVRLERERDGRFTLYDLGSTNGVKVNGVRTGNNRVLHDGDEIIIGATTLVFQQAGDDLQVPLPPATSRARRARLLTPDGRDQVLASETLIGRAVTSDIILDLPGVATKHARIVSPDPSAYFLEALPGVQQTLLNGHALPVGRRASLADGDEIHLGDVSLRFVGGQS